MSKGTFERALALVFELEGGFVQHPKDPGGATNLGITRATLARARARPVSVGSVKALTRAEAGHIYRRFYWEPIRADDLPPGLDVALFDFAVNSGAARAIRCLQTVLGLPPDGRVGPQTLAAASAADPDETVRVLTRERLRFLRSLPTWTTFGRGWTSRTTRVEAAALAAAAASDTLARGPGTPTPFLATVQQEEKTMFETKTLLASRTVWANLIGLGILGLGMFGVQTGTIDQNGLADAMAQIAAGISFVASTFFRVRATKQIAAAAN